MANNRAKKDCNYPTSENENLKRYARILLKIKKVLEYLRSYTWRLVFVELLATDDTINFIYFNSAYLRKQCLSQSNQTYNISTFSRALFYWSSYAEKLGCQVKCKLVSTNSDNTTTSRRFNLELIIWNIATVIKMMKF